MNDLERKRIGEEELARLKAELASIFDSATEQQKKCYLGETDDDSVSIEKRIAFNDKLIETMKLAGGLKHLIQNSPEL